MDESSLITRPQQPHPRIDQEPGSLHKMLLFSLLMYMDGHLQTSSIHPSLPITAVRPANGLHLKFDAEQLWQSFTRYHDTLFSSFLCRIGGRKCQAVVLGGEATAYESCCGSGKSQWSRLSFAGGFSHCLLTS